MAAACIMQSAEIGGAAYMFGKCGLIAEPRKMLVPAGFPFRLHGIELIHLAAMQRRVKIAEAHIAGDRVSCDPPLYQLNRTHAGLPGNVGIACAQLTADLDKIGWPPLTQMASIAPRPAGADPSGFQNHGADTRFSEGQSRGKPRQPTADNGNIGVQLTFQPWIGGAVRKLAFIKAVCGHFSWRRLRIMLPQGRLAERSGSRASPKSRAANNAWC